MGAKLLALLLESAATGGLYVTVALGLSLVAGVMRLLNLAQGEFLVGSVYLILTLMRALHIDPFLSMLGTLPIVFAGAYLIQRSLLQDLMAHSGEAPLVATFGLSIAAQAAFQMAYGSNPMALTSDLGLTGVTILGHTVRWVSVLAVAVGVALTTSTHFLLSGTTFGKSLRAAAEDPMAAQSLGIDVRHVFALCFGLGAVLTACGAIVVGIGFSVEPTSGILWLIRGVTVVVIGGMGSIWGTLIAGGVVGLVEEVGVFTLGPEYRDLVIFTLLVLLLVIRPSGLFVKGRR
jgi:branched-chain amino acid transport system permease protein